MLTMRTALTFYRFTCGHGGTMNEQTIKRMDMSECPKAKKTQRSCTTGRQNNSNGTTKQTPSSASRCPTLVPYRFIARSSQRQVSQSMQVQEPIRRRHLRWQRRWCEPTRGRLRERRRCLPWALQKLVRPRPVPLRQHPRRWQARRHRGALENELPWRLVGRARPPHRGGPGRGRVGGERRGGDRGILRGVRSGGGPPEGLEQGWHASRPRPLSAGIECGSLPFTQNGCDRVAREWWFASS
ncbi:hypothetical protein BC628DRAFT_698502 [Trametes gibbosa]|nr:hypothetical protein BC628DRAFT_698502 [Trametes gibbosa]